jgi:hypothetical protein
MSRVRVRLIVVPKGSKTPSLIITQVGGDKENTFV